MTTDDFTATAVVDGDSATSAEVTSLTGQPVEVENISDQTVTAPAEGDATQPVGTVNTEAPAQPAPEAKPAGPTEDEINEAVAKFGEVLDEVTGLGKDDNGNVDPTAKGEREASTGAITDALKTKVQAAFAALPRGTTKASARPKAKDLVDSRLLAAMDAMDMPLARTLFTVQQDCLTVRGAGSEGTGITAKPVDPTEDFVNRVTIHSLAAYALVPGEAVEADWPTRVEALVGELAGQVRPHVDYLAAQAEYDALSDEDKGKYNEPVEPETHDLVKAAVKVSQGRGTGVRRPRKASTGGEGGTSAPRAPYTGNRRSVAKHIEEAFANQPVGTWLSIAQIAKFESAEYSGDKVSQGAVSARVYAPGGCTIAGIKPQENADGKKGAVKIA